MKHPITKQQIKAIKRGDTGELCKAFETLIDLHNLDMFDEGYRSRISDESVVAYRLAEYIGEQSEKIGMRFSLSRCIEQYFKDALEND